MYLKQRQIFERATFSLKLWHTALSTKRVFRAITGLGSIVSYLLVQVQTVNTDSAVTGFPIHDKFIDGEMVDENANSEAEFSLFLPLFLERILKLKL